MIDVTGGMRRWAPLALLLAIALGATACGDAYQEAQDSTEDATAVVESILLGDAWIGRGEYSVEAARKAYSAQCDCTVIAARIEINGGDRTLFWRADGRAVGDGLIVGDATTRRFSDWGAAAGPGSPADQLAEAAKDTDEGKAVLLAVGQQP